MNIFQKIVNTSVLSLSFVTLSIGDVWAVTVGIFSNTNYTRIANVNNVSNTLTSFGHRVTPFNSLDANIWQSIADTNQVIIIPAMDRFLFPDLSEATRTVIRDYVSSGGGFMTMGIRQEARDLMNGLFNYIIIDEFSPENAFFLNETDATGTPYEDNPTTLPKPSFAGTMRIDSLPSGSLNFYDDLNGRSTVFVSPFGTGKVGYNGETYTFIDEVGNWTVVTNTTVEFIAGEPRNTIPEPSTVMGLLTLGIVGSITKSILPTA